MVLVMWMAVIIEVELNVKIRLKLQCAHNQNSALLFSLPNSQLFMCRRSTGRSSLQHFRFAFGPAIVVVATIVVIAVAAVVCPGLESDGNGANSKLIIV